MKELNPVQLEGVRGGYIHFGYVGIQMYIGSVKIAASILA
jgi:hypothetical protein